MNTPAPRLVVNTVEGLMDYQVEQSIRALTKEERKVIEAQGRKALHDMEMKLFGKLTFSDPVVEQKG